ncbi:hypothetical protein Tco_0834083 [Tanacetum coccineum]
MNLQTSTVPKVTPQFAYQSPQAPTHPTESPFGDSGFLLPIISSKLPLIQETKPLFKMAGLPCNKFRGDNGKIILVLLIRAMLLVQGEILTSGQARVEKAMLAEAQEAGQILDEEQIAFLVDPRIPTDEARTIIPHNAAF